MSRKKGSIGKKPIRPQRLKAGDRIGIVAPASYFDRETFDQGLSVLSSMGFEPVFDDGLYEKHHSFAGTDHHRADQIHRYFSDKGIKGIVCARGGFGSIRILAQLDLNLIRNNPKCFIGFSDITALHSVMSQKCGFVVFHGPNVTTLAKATQKTREHFYETLTSDLPVRLKANKGLAINSGRATGPVYGGNLNTLCHLLGTPFQPEFKGQILLLEDTAEAPYKIDRMLTQMKLAGCFDSMAGMVLGTFRGCGKKEDIYRVFDDVLSEYDFPILAGLPVGHTRSNLTVPIGIQATLDVNEKELSFHGPATHTVP